MRIGIELHRALHVAHRFGPARGAEHVAAEEVLGHEAREAAEAHDLGVPSSHDVVARPRASSRASASRALRCARPSRSARAPSCRRRVRHDRPRARREKCASGSRRLHRDRFRREIFRFGVEILLFVLVGLVLAKVDEGARGFPVALPRRWNRRRSRPCSRSSAPDALSATASLSPAAMCSAAD